MSSKKNRKKYILDKSLQVKTAFSIIGVVSLVAVIILTAIAASVVYNNAKVNNVYEIEDSIFQMMQAANFDNDNIDEGYKHTLDNLTNLHNKNYTTITTISQYNKYLLILLIITILAQGLVLYFMIIRITHRIAGPIHVISNYFKVIIAGEIPKPRPLRDKDELKDFYDLFIALVDTLTKESDKVNKDNNNNKDNDNDNDNSDNYKE